VTEVAGVQSVGSAIDWTAPWLAPHRSVGEPIGRLIESGTSVVDALNQALARRSSRAAAKPRCFVGQQALSTGEPYESFIGRTGSVPTRENAHDLFNGLAWLTHPALKARLNALHIEQIEHGAVGAIRGPVRDALTLFDENAAWLQAPPELIDALRQRDWAALFVTHRVLWSHARLELFGHALIEKLIRPRKPITAHVWVVPFEVADPAAWLAGHLGAEVLASRPWLPLPVLGVPGWWNLNEHPGFYDDATVFRRSARALKSGGSTA